MKLEPEALALGLLKPGDLAMIAFNRASLNDFCYMANTDAMSGGWKSVKVGTLALIVARKKAPQYYVGLNRQCYMLLVGDTYGWLIDHCVESL